MRKFLTDEFRSPVVVHFSVIQTHDCHDESDKPYNLTIRVTWPGEDIDGIAEMAQRIEDGLIGYSAMPGTFTVDASVTGIELDISTLLLHVMIPGCVHTGCRENEETTCLTCGDTEGVVAHIVLYIPYESVAGSWKFMALIHANDLSFYE